MAPSKLKITPIAATIFEWSGFFHNLCSSQCCPFVYISVAEWLMFSSHLPKDSQIKSTGYVYRTHSYHWLYQNHIFVLNTCPKIFHVVSAMMAELISFEQNCGFYYIRWSWLSLSLWTCYYRGVGFDITTEILKISIFSYCRS